jgi:hypothetical protein
VTKRDTYFNTDGYDATANDDVHICGDVTPSVSIVGNGTGGAIKVSVSPGKFGESGITVTGTANGSPLTFSKVGAFYEAPYSGTPKPSISVTVTDSGYYTGTDTE